VTNPPPASVPDRISVGSVVLDRGAYLVLVDGEPVTLALQEFKLLELLMSHAGRVVASERILEAVWGPDFSGDPSTLAVHVLRLRRKLDRGSAGRQLRTVRGLGYVFDTVPIGGQARSATGLGSEGWVIR
jgi:two-component system response regulator RegX3